MTLALFELDHKICFVDCNKEFLFKLITFGMILQFPFVVIAECQLIKHLTVTFRFFIYLFLFIY